MAEGVDVVAWVVGLAGEARVAEVAVGWGEVALAVATAGAARVEVVAAVAEEVTTVKVGAMAGVPEEEGREAVVAVAAEMGDGARSPLQPSNHV